jgi:hypothetical protein
MIGQEVKVKHKVKIVCEVCGIVGYLQHIGKNYYRVRHYVGFKNGKPLFTYHRQDPQYVHKLLEQEGNIDQVDQSGIDQNLKVRAFFNKNKVRGCPSLVGGRPAKSVVLWAARVQIPHPAPQT